MDGVSSEARYGLPSELLYAADLVLMVPTMEQLGRRVAEWMMVGNSGGKMIVNWKVALWCLWEMSAGKHG